MKSYKNKKSYNFTKAQKRKKRTRSAKIDWKSNTWEYRRMLRQNYRAKCKVVLHKNLWEEEKEFPIFKNTLWWEY